MEKQLQVNAIKDGTVIDHIPTNALFRVIKILKIEDTSNMVTFGNNLDSGLMGFKAIIKVANRFFEDAEVNKIALVAPHAKLNIILVTIFQFKNIARQATFSRINILIVIVIFGLISYDVWECTKLITGSYSMKIALAFPLIAMVLIYMALKAIKKDEQLLKSINRIR